MHTYISGLILWLLCYLHKSCIMLIHTLYVHATLCFTLVFFHRYQFYIIGFYSHASHVQIRQLPICHNGVCVHVLTYWNSKVSPTTHFHDIWLHNNSIMLSIIYIYMCVTRCSYFVTMQCACDQSQLKYWIFFCLITLGF